MNGLSGKILKLKRYSYYPNDYYYEKLFTEYDNLEFFYTIIHSTNRETFQSSKEIIFRNEISFGSSSEAVLNELGKPDCIYHKAEDFNYKILFYRFKLGGHKTKCELHFMDDRLFFFNYIFSYVSNNDKINLIQLLSNKYLNGEKLNITECQVYDKSNNFIIVEDSNDFFIRYMWGNEELMTKIQNIFEIAKQINNQRIKLRYQELYQNL